jgi:alpha-galactosidase
MMKPFIQTFCVASLLLLPLFAGGETVPLSSLDLARMEQGYGQPGINVSVDKNPLNIGGRSFETGVGTHATSELWLDLRKQATRFTAFVGVDAEAGKKGSVEFRVKGDGKLLWTSGVMHGGEPAKRVDLDLRGVDVLALTVRNGEDGVDFDHADWADASLEITGVKPQTLPVPHRPVVILTPKPGPIPRINGPIVFGVRPGSPFLYAIPATGTRPMLFGASGLPGGLKIDPANGRITGFLSQRGDYPITLLARNALGTAQKPFHIVVGNDIALTPPMGWNSWNCWGDQVTQDKVLRSARALIASGLDQHGWTYINIDDTWQGERVGRLNAIQPNPERFPDIKALCDLVHGMGLKIGIYSTPWAVSYGNRLGGSSNNADGKWDPSADLHAGKNNHSYPFDVGRYHFAANDAAQWAQWGIDYLKYDWGPVDVESTREMGNALRVTGRDIFYSLSNNAAGNIFSIISELSPLANAWRTTTDINDSWGSVSGIGFNQDKWAKFQRPGHYNDPDMLVVGQVGWGSPHPTHLTADEQYSHISLWCLLGAPLLIGCDLEKLDDFTLGLLTNDEVLAIDQDPLCKQGTRVASEQDLDIYSKPLADGSLAVGLFNRGMDDAAITANWDNLKLSGKQRIRDLWSQKDLGIFDGKFQAEVPSHGVVLVRFMAAATKSVGVPAEKRD